MDRHDVLVIGGSAAGIVAATTTKAFYPDKSVLLVRKEHSVMVPCGIPYVFGTLEGCGQNQIPDAAVTGAGVELQETEITSIDLESKVCTTNDGRELGFDKLVLATGSTPKEPTWLPGAKLANVYVIPKDREYLELLLGRLPGMTDVVVIGRDSSASKSPMSCPVRGRTSRLSRRSRTFSVWRSTRSSRCGRRRSSATGASR